MEDGAEDGRAARRRRTSLGGAYVDAGPSGRGAWAEEDDAYREQARAIVLLPERAGGCEVQDAHGGSV